MFCMLMGIWFNHGNGLLRARVIVGLRRLFGFVFFYLFFMPPEFFFLCAATAYEKDKQFFQNFCTRDYTGEFDQLNPVARILIESRMRKCNKSFCTKGKEMLFYRSNVAC